jgi:tetratricopeptide (TPR) repeat protein
VEIRARAMGEDHVDVAADRAALAAILDGLGRRDEAEALLHSALRTFERVLGPGHHEVACTLANLAAIAYRRGRAPDADALYGRALAIKEHLLGARHPELAILLNNLAVLAAQRVKGAITPVAPVGTGPGAHTVGRPQRRIERSRARPRG